MKQTDNYKLTLYEKEDKMSITAEENSLNANMKIIDSALKGKASIEDMTNYIEEHKDELKGETGEAGQDGTNGVDGADGQDGYSPTATVTQTETGATITITDKNGTTTTNITNGKDGEKGDTGATGNDGVSATHSWNGTTLTITSASGTSSADLKGEKGEKGATGSDGKDGTDGVGISSVTQTTTSTTDGGTNVITVTKTDGTTSTFSVKNGSKGSTGATGETGADGYTPVKGTDYWTEADKEEIISELEESTVTLDKGYISLPNSVHCKVGNEFKVYFRNILSRKDLFLWVGYSSKLTTKYYDDYFSVIATEEGTTSLPWKVFDEARNLYAEGTLNIIATSTLPSSATTALVIGDSTVNDGTMTTHLAELYEADGLSLTLLGTRGSGAGVHEGRGGWTAEMYCTSASYSDIENPFYNNGFDFSYYMTNQGYESVQAVVIQLGINDIFAFKEYSWASYDSSKPLGYLTQMVNSILAYDATIKIIINLPTTPNSNGTSFTETYGTTQLYWIYDKNIIRFAEELEDYFAYNSSVTISASNCILDTKTQIRDGVHPTSEGYQALGQRLYEVLISVVDGSTVVVSLLNVMNRERDTYNGTVNAADVHELSGDKYYDAAFNGVRSISVKNNNGTFTVNSSNSFTFNAVQTAGNGIEFPVPSLEVGKSYSLEYSVNAAGRVYLMKYTSNGVFDSYTMYTATAGTFTKTIVPEEGYIYSILFCPFVKESDCTFSDISLTEVV